MSLKWSLWTSLKETRISSSTWSTPMKGIVSLSGSLQRTHAFFFFFWWSSDLCLAAIVRYRSKRWLRSTRTSEIRESHFLSGVFQSVHFILSFICVCLCEQAFQNFVCVCISWLGVFLKPGKQISVRNVWNCGGWVMLCKSLLLSS